MRILIDECAPRRLRRHLPGHDVHTVGEMGWSGKTDRELLALMAGAGFEVLLTVDQNIRHQQNLKAAGVAAVVLVAASNRLADLVPLVPAALAALGSIRPGDVVEISPP
jgi:predicted nuclease of predicted toxin-antitoxin system